MGRRADPQAVDHRVLQAGDAGSGVDDPPAQLRRVEGLDHACPVGAALRVGREGDARREVETRAFRGGPDRPLDP